MNETNTAEINELQVIPPHRLLLTAKQTTEALAIGPRKLWEMTASGEIPHIRIGRSLRYPISELQSWIGAKLEGGPKQTTSDTSTKKPN